MKLSTRDKLMIGAGVAGLVLIYIAAKKAKDVAVTVVTKKLNPVSPENFAYTGVNGIGSAITGNDFNLGVSLFETEQAVKNAANSMLAKVFPKAKKMTPYKKPKSPAKAPEILLPENTAAPDSFMLQSSPGSDPIIVNPPTNKDGFLSTLGVL